MVVCIAFSVLYFNAVNKALTMSYSFSISATIALALLFFPKIFIIVVHPEKNVRYSFFPTFQGIKPNNIFADLRTQLQNSLDAILETLKE